MWSWFESPPCAHRRRGHDVLESLQQLGDIRVDPICIGLVPGQQIAEKRTMQRLGSGLGIHCCWLSVAAVVVVVYCRGR
jgi:hypothetical protein